MKERTKEREKERKKFMNVQRFFVTTVCVHIGENISKVTETERNRGAEKRQ